MVVPSNDSVSIEVPFPHDNFTYFCVVVIVLNECGYDSNCEYIYSWKNYCIRIFLYVCAEVRNSSCEFPLITTVFPSPTVSDVATVSSSPGVSTTSPMFPNTATMSAPG